MRYRQISSALFIENRRRFVEFLPPGAVCIIHSNDIPQTNADGTGSFTQNSHLFWLSGIDQEDSILVLCPDHPVSERRELLFVRESSEHTLIWEGNKLTKEEAIVVSGIEHILWTTAFEAMLKKLLSEKTEVFLCVDHHSGRTLGPLSRNHRFVLWCKDEYPLHQYHNAAPIINNLRMIKTPEEIGLIRQACAISHSAFLAACRSVQAGKYEYEIEAEYAREIIRHGGSFAYAPIIASGEQSCVLHYISNDRLCKDGDLLLMDVGANYANYASDMTRTVPVNGRFTARQRAVYIAVLKLLRGAVSLMKPGASFTDYHSVVAEMADEALVDLGLLSMQEIKTQSPSHPVRKKYFPHLTAHFLGLDVHDVGDSRALFTAGMVLTCEPGIYVRAEGFGIRLENDILITEGGNEDLMADIPLEADEILEIVSRA